MPSILALIIFVVLVTMLLYIERKRNDEASLTLWVPTFWVLICGSRPIVLWFQPTSTSWYSGGASIEAGSPLDRLVLCIFIILAILILLKRKIDWAWILKDNIWLILLFLYMGISILWSDIAFVSFKRWVKSTADILMALVVLSERRPLQALESVFRRCAYVLIPFSLLLIKYFPHLGISYGRYSGGQMWGGVTLHKNSLGQLCALSAFFLIWAALREWRSGNLFKARYQTYADVVVLSLAVFLLGGGGTSYSATSVGSFIVGIATLLLLYRSEKFARYIARHLKALVVSLTLICVLIYDSILRIVASILERDETLTGRVEIWSLLYEFASQNPVLGVGYGGFVASRNWKMEEMFGTKYILARAHSGYLAVYVEIGIVGILLLAAFLLAYCAKVRRELNHAFEWGVYGICLLPMTLLWNFTEVNILQSTSYLWATMVFLVVAFSASQYYKREL